MLSYVELAFGVVYLVEGSIVSADKINYFLAGALTLICGYFCLQAARDAKNYKPAKLMLAATIVLGLVGMVIGFFLKASAFNISTVAVDVAIAAYMLKLVRDIQKEASL